MTKTSSPLYLSTPANADRRIDEAMRRGCTRAVKQPLVFFRADDVGIPSRRFTELIECFTRHAMPLCLATVPTWLTKTRLADIRRITGTRTGQWCWHQHGHVHRNFEKSGKKQEFGPARPPRVIAESLAGGRVRLESLLGKDFLPVFTPPWNRCSQATLKALSDLGFQALSRDLGASPETLPDLPDFQVCVDLHTRKEPSPLQSFEALLQEIEEGLASGLCGIMIHHQRMNSHALELLHLLLARIRKHRGIISTHFGELLETRP